MDIELGDTLVRMEARRLCSKTSDPKQGTYLLISPGSTDKRKFTGFLVLRGYERETCESDTILQGLLNEYKPYEGLRVLCQSCGLFIISLSNTNRPTSLSRSATRVVSWLVVPSGLGGGNIPNCCSNNAESQ